MSNDLEMQACDRNAQRRLSKAVVIRALDQARPVLLTASLSLFTLSFVVAMSISYIHMG